MKRSIASTVAAALLAGPALAQANHYLVTVEPRHAARGFERVSVSKAALGSTPIRLWENTAINPDCSAMTPASTLTIVTPPRHGTATISEEPFYIAFPPTNPRSACNTRKLPGHQAFYAAAPGFVGHDRLVLRGAGPEGRVREITVDIDVR
ncbi:MAG: hypothetical protein JOZ27_07020 [Caulobacteraceae bacterium]|nr:hypothetical protein [Caulobacteraceae bacterium]